MRMAAERGALTQDADKFVHELLQSDADIQAAVISTFGSEVRKANGTIDRGRLASIVFDDPEALKELERLLHPAVRQRLFAQIDASEARIVFVEAIKLLEGGLAQSCDQIWVTRCPAQKQIERLVVCRGLDEETATMRVNVQSSQEEKVSQADIVIDTDGTMADTQRYFDLVWKRLVQDLAPSKVEQGKPAATGSQTTTGRSSPPQRLSATAAAELRRRYAREQTNGSEPVIKPELSETQKEGLADSSVTVRRARPSDIPAILLLIQRATNGKVKLKRSELLEALGERGYLIGQTGTEISAVAGWSSENLVARIEQIFICPLDAVNTTGIAILQEIENTAGELICEVILAFVPKDGPKEIQQLFKDRQFVHAEPGTLPEAWRAAVDESQPDNSIMMMKVLRDTRAK